MSTTHLIVLVEKLRQEQSFVTFYKQQIRQSVQELNNNCDQVFHSLWLSHTLSYGLHRVLTHNSYTQEWSQALSLSQSVKFVNASKIKSFHFVDRYSVFLTHLLEDHKLLSEILHHVETEGLDCAWVVSDMTGVVFGHCVFQQDHMIFLKLMRELLKCHIERCESSKDLFGGVESVFSHMLTGYCSQLLELRTFMTEVLCEPVMQVLTSEDYLEFDINKAATRFQHLSDHNGLVGSTTFLFSEDLEASCKKLANLAMAFLERLSLASHQLPISIQWLLGTLRKLVKEKWPNISPIELRRPISDAIFSSILSSPIVNPESYGVVDPSLIISEMGRYNLTQVMSVLQGCVWVMDKTSSTKYPIHKVVRMIDVNLFYSVVDGKDWISPDNIPEVPSILPGLRRSAVLASQDQLDSLVGLVAMLVASREGKGTFHKRLSSLLNCLLPAMMEQATKNPYPILSRAYFSSPPPPSPSSSSSSSTMPSSAPPDQDKPRSSRRKGKKYVSGSLEALDSSVSFRGRNMASPQPAEGRGKSMKRSVSNEAGLCVAATPSGFQLPSVVLVLPVQEKSVNLGTVQWDFDLLSEEEFMSQKVVSPDQKSSPQDNFQFSTFLHPHPHPQKKLTITAAPATPTTATPTTDERTLGEGKEAEKNEGSLGEERARAKSEGFKKEVRMREEKKGVELGERGLRRQTSAGGRVQSMIDAIEKGKRIRSNTLPSSLSESDSDHLSQLNLGFHSQSEGGFPADSTAVLNGKMEDSNVLVEGDEPVFTDCEEPSNPAVNRSETVGSSTIPLPRTSELMKPFTEQALTVSVSMEDSASYVRVHPLPIIGSLGRPNGSEDELADQLASATIQPDGGDEDLNSYDSSPMKEPNTLVVNAVEVRSGSSSPDMTYCSDDADKTPVHVSRQAQNDSMQNLYNIEGGALQVSGVVSERKKKKKKWRIFKKRKSVEEQVDGKYRSKSDAPRQLHKVDFRDQQPRSLSHHVDGDGGVARRRRQDCYTLYMQDYTDKLEEQKKHSPSHREGGPSTALPGNGGEGVDLASTNDDLDRGEATPPAEMSSLDFKKSLYCHQLKFKLRSALQNIHSSLSMSHAHVQLQEVMGVASRVRYQLILLLQRALQRRQWMQQDMETALLSEIMRMVEPLPNELMEVVLDGVYEDYHRRSAYIAYLVHSHQKFQDARMQVAAVQEAINRILYINMELFISFSVCLFLEMPGQPRLSRLKAFSERMENLFLTDEKCSLMSRHLHTFSMAILEEDTTWQSWEDQDRVVACLSDYLFTRVYTHVFYPNGSTDKEVDKIFSDHLAMLAKTITIRHQSLQIPSVYHSGCPWAAAQRHLRDMAAYKSPRGKLHCIVQSLRILISLLQYARCGDPPGADDLFPVLVYVLIQANPAGMLSTCQYIRNFEETSLQGEAAYWWAQFSTAVEFTKTLS